MRRFLVIAAVLALAGLVPLGIAAAVSPTVRLAIVHVVSGCHVWKTTKTLGESGAVTVRRGSTLALRVDCPMDFDLVQTAGPRLALGNRRVFAGTTRAIAFRKPGLYRFVARNVQSSEQQGLQTLGADHTLRLTVRVP